MGVAVELVVEVVPGRRGRGRRRVCSTWWGGRRARAGPWCGGACRGARRGCRVRPWCVRASCSGAPPGRSRQGARGSRGALGSERWLSLVLRVVRAEGCVVPCRLCCLSVGRKVRPRWHPSRWFRCGVSEPDGGPRRAGPEQRCCEGCERTHHWLHGSGAVRPQVLVSLYTSLRELGPRRAKCTVGPLCCFSHRRHRLLQSTATQHLGPAEHCFAVNMYIGARERRVETGGEMYI